ncbi:Type IV pilus biogenesis and competence protein PilQ precursor [Rubripirellula amarantea]|uniref:Type IV pilus biogenesis and competence protein PilQ n=1 Tax=Rubripirellula amarantea TaxID=2527999 RepID=A0A5C5WVL4_9BACT|nr:type II secretion system protein GspD [Rubripirellula amarantea]TWT53975.1 Type IV pilus biogenesis and competence protein PilQ precursor [Rubripirellula amarantea]
MGWLVLGCVWVGTLGCVSRPLPVRPSVEQLINESLSHSMPDYEIENVPLLEDEYIEGEIEFSDELSDLPVGSSVILDGQVIVQNHQTDEVMGHPMNVVANSDYFELENAPSYDGPLFTEDFIETDIREVLTIIAEDAGIDLVVDEKVAGVVNAKLEDMPLDRAIEKVLMPLGFHYARHGNQHYVGPADPESPLFSYISTRMEYRPMHLDADVLLETVPKTMQPFVQGIKDTNLIIVEAPDRIGRQLVDRFVAMDQPVPQVILEAIICVVEPDSSLQFGLDWNHAVELNGSNALQLGVNGLALSSTYSGAGANALFDDFAKTSTFVKLLSEHGYLTIRATPHVMAQDNQQANIVINRETFFSVQPNNGNASGDNSAFFFQQDIQTVQSGITLDITPRIRGDIVTIDIEKAEVSEDVRNANTELAVNPFPIINRRSVSTTVHVKDGKTIVIGGLVQRETIDRVNRIPGLSKLPGVGYLFETTQRQTRDAEVVIFISPKIVTPQHNSQR